MNPSFWRSSLATYRKEMATYFYAAEMYVFLLVFALAANWLALSSGNMLARGIADLSPLFAILPWLLMVFAPALAMRSMADEFRQNTFEWIAGLPISLTSVIMGKFFAAWTVATFGLALTTPIWMTITWLGTPDQGPIIAGYVMSWLVAGAFVALGIAASAIVPRHAPAFVLGAAANFLTLAGGLPLGAKTLRDTFGPGGAEAGRVWSLFVHLDNASRGLITIQGVVFAVSLIALGIAVAVVICDGRREQGRS